MSESEAETAAISADPEALLRMAQSEAELARGEVVTADELAAAIAERRHDETATRPAE
ncbi:hypothetical protein ACFWUP_25480 [Nocardia sp. NPDC058658]|uniref:hypothetical protein n=1 Tax=Nocardia sp. NPDC058658 TaxID=3346580 RepID=UPI00364FB3B1